jgi:acid phosphatase type 7
MLHQGTTRNRPPKGHAQAHPGVHPLSDLTHRSQKFQQLPDPLGPPPYHFSLETAIPGIGKKAQDHKKIIFHTCGDTGGVKNEDYQSGVAAAMKGDLLKKDESPSFFYHIGDVVYFNGEVSSYYDQFYEPYDQYNVPIIAIPGNHDGEVDPPSTLPSLQGFVRYFMSPTSQVLPESKDAPRVTMSLPNVYFTLDAPFVTVIGMYTNVPEHGSIDSIQQQWLTNEFATAPKNKALIVALHHPIYSFDDHHSGSARMADAVQHAINDSRRVPNMVLTGHVHNYQRIEKTIVDGGGPTPFFVIGHGGYPHLHGMNADVGGVDPESGATLVAFEKKRHGYVTLTVDSTSISGTMTTTDPVDELPTPDVDTFSYPAAAIFLGADAVVSL